MNKLEVREAFLRSRIEGSMTRWTVQEWREKCREFMSLWPEDPGEFNAALFTICADDFTADVKEFLMSIAEERGLEYPHEYNVVGKMRRDYTARTKKDGDI